MVGVRYNAADNVAVIVRVDKRDGQRFQLFCRFVAQVTHDAERYAVVDNAHYPLQNPGCTHNDAETDKQRCDASEINVVFADDKVYRFTDDFGHIKRRRGGDSRKQNGNNDCKSVFFKAVQLLFICQYYMRHKIMQKFSLPCLKGRGLCYIPLISFLIASAAAVSPAAPGTGAILGGLPLPVLRYSPQFCGFMGGSSLQTAVTPETPRFLSS